MNDNCIRRGVGGGNSREREKKDVLQKIRIPYSAVSLVDVTLPNRYDFIRLIMVYF